MVVLSNVSLNRVTRRISSGDAGAPLDPPLTADEIEAGGRAEDFLSVSATGDDEHQYQWTFQSNTTKSQIQDLIKAWFTAGKPSTVTSPMLSAIDTPPPETWDTSA
jgi:hypothetical protein